MIYFTPWYNCSMNIYTFFDQKKVDCLSRMLKKKFALKFLKAKFLASISRVGPKFVISMP